MRVSFFKKKLLQWFCFETARATSDYLRAFEALQASHEPSGVQRDFFSLYFQTKKKE